MSSDKFWIRNQTDRLEAHAVLFEDLYQLKSWGARSLLNWILDVGAGLGAFTRAVKLHWVQSQVIAVDWDLDAEPFFHLNTADSHRVHYHTMTFSSPLPKETEAIAEDSSDLRHESFTRTNILDVLAHHGSPELDLVKLDHQIDAIAVLKDLYNGSYLPRIHRICGIWNDDDAFTCIAGHLQKTHRIDVQRADAPLRLFIATNRLHRDDQNQSLADGICLAPRTIQQMYPPVPVETLASDFWQQRFKQYFLETGEFDVDPFETVTTTHRPQRKCFSVSLFKQNVHNRHRNEFGVDEEYWTSKYWTGLLNIVDELPKFPGWKLRIFVEFDLWERTCERFVSHPQIELYRMAVNSIGACPGALWRYIALADRSLELVMATDIDEPLAWKTDDIQSFEMDSWSSIGRLGSFINDRKYLISPNDSPAKSYATILGSRVASRPSKFDFDPVAAMRGFMALRKSFSTSERPWSFADDERPTAYNQPIGTQIYGWGSHWYMYGFDERFLKHVMYYHFGRIGGIHTWSPSINPARLDPEGNCDLQYVRSHGNVTVCPQTIVRLVPLQLTIDALRIVFLLDEYRWVFDSLGDLVRKHAPSKVCCDIKDHNCIEHIPRQLNLFHAGRQTARIMQIGFNSGQCTAILMLANPMSRIRVFDQCDLAYTKPCLSFLNSTFGNRITLVEGDSQNTVASDFERGYDLIHIDGDHSFDMVVGDLANSLPKCQNGGIVVMNDYEAENDVYRATCQRIDLEPTNDHTVRAVFPGSSHAFFHYRATE